ncbi:mechanosensitive ion channel family protein [Microbulbifer donghaiensis]|nr:mechanosensitive ion channel domain-containing protein [Microbulbifer donghaiensis]
MKVVLLQLVTLVVVAQSSDPEASLADPGQHPLEPLDLSSPRATLSSFLSRGDELARYARTEYWSDPSRQLAQRLAQKQAQIRKMLDLSKIPPAARDDFGNDAAIYLYDVLSRIELPPWDEIPGREKVAELAPIAVEQTGGSQKKSGVAGAVGAIEGGNKDAEDGVSLASWTVPHTEVTLVRLTDGPQSGKFVFSADTVARAHEFYRRVRDLPYQRELPLRNYAEMRPYLAMRGWLVSPQRIESFPDWMKRSIFRQAVWKWLALIVAIAVYGLFFAVLYRLSARFRRSEHMLVALSRFVVPLVLLVATLPLATFLHRQLTLTDAVGGAVSLVAELISYIALAWLAWSLPLAIMEIYIHRSRVLDQSLDANLLRFIARTLGLVGVIAVAFLLTSRLGAPLYSLVAGFGIGGVAIALAMRGSFENFIGSLNLFGDKPVKVGDFCRYGEDAGDDFQRAGTVESIGMRSTRLRGIDNSLTTIPNAEFSQMHIVNYTTRRHILLKTALSLRFETSEDQLRFLLVNIREMLVGHPRVVDEEPSVRFAGFGSSGLIVQLRVDIDSNDFPEYRAICEDIYFRIFRIVHQSGTDFAFRSQTIYFSRDGGIDVERQQSAEAQVREWAAAQEMPFPNFSPEQRAALRNTVYYPPEGAPGSEG